MDIQRIKAILKEASGRIQKAESFSDKMGVVHDILDEAYPKRSELEALCGPITSFVDSMNRMEIEPLLAAIKESADTGHRFTLTDKELDIALKTIYAMTR